MIRASFTDFIKVEDGIVVRYVVASWPATRKRERGNVTVYRIDEDGHEKVRYLDYRPIAGYLVDLDFEDDTWYNISGNCRAMRLLTAWKKDHRTELLVGAHLDRLVANGNFLRMRNERQKAVLSFIRKTPGSECWSLEKVLFVMHGHTPGEYDAWRQFRSSYGTGCAFDVYRYLDGYKFGLDMYRDYIETAQRCGHDVKDHYWKFPKDLKKAHDKVMKEWENIQRARRLAEKAAATKREKEKKKKFEKVVGKWIRKKVRKNCMVVSVPADIQAVRVQAKKLHQCIESCDYIGKMAERKCLLVFITTKEGAPVATAEILPSGKVGQFYGDEAVRDMKKMKPGKKAQEALDAWLKKFKPRWRKAA